MSAIISYAHAAGAPVSKETLGQQKQESTTTTGTATGATAIESGVAKLNVTESDGKDKSAKKVVANVSATESADRKSQKTQKSDKSTSKEPESESESANPAGAAGSGASTSSASSANSASSATAAKKQVKLAPAPLPSTNVWGAPVVAPAPSADNGPITESIILPENNGSSDNVVKAATGKEKWVPFKASVVLATNKSASPKNGSSKKKNKKRVAGVAAGANKEQEAKDGAKKGTKKQHNTPVKADKEVSQESTPEVKSDEETDAAAASASASAATAATASVESDAATSEVTSSGSAADSEVASADAKQALESDKSSSSPTSPDAADKFQHNSLAANKRTSVHHHGQYNNHHGQHHNKPFNKHNNQGQGQGQGQTQGQNQNGSYQPRNFRMHYNGNQNRRYSNPNGKINGGLSYIPYNNRQFFVSNQNGNGNGQSRHHHNNRNSFHQSPYMMHQPFYAPMPYMPYPAGPAGVAGPPPAAAFPPVLAQQPSQFAVPPQDEKLREVMLVNLAKQIDYYFSQQNLVKDIFLRKNMNDDGFLPLRVIAGFYRVSGLSFGDINLVVESLSYCGNLEYGFIESEDGEKEYKVRAKGDYSVWVLPADQRLDSGRDSKSPEVKVNEDKEEQQEEETIEQKEDAEQ